MLHCVSVSNQLQQWTNFCTNFSPPPRPLLTTPLHALLIRTMWCSNAVGYTMDTMYFSWQESPVEIDPGVQLPQFVLNASYVVLETEILRSRSWS